MYVEDTIRIELSHESKTHTLGNNGQKRVLHFSGSEYFMHIS